MLLVLLTMDTCLVQFSHSNILVDKDGWHRIQKRQHMDCFGLRIIAHTSQCENMTNIRKKERKKERKKDSLFSQQQRYILNVNDFPWQYSRRINE